MPNSTARRSPGANSQPAWRAGLVTRVSTQRQADNEEGSLKNQLQRLRTFVKFKQTGERTSDATAARAERGLWNGGRLFGYDLDAEHKGYLLANEQEAGIVVFAFETYLECGSLAGTVEALNAAGYRTKAYTSRNA